MLIRIPEMSAHACRAIAIVLAATLTACIPIRVSTRSIENAESRWNASGIADYSFTFSKSAFTHSRDCEAEDGTVAVEVRGGRTTKFGTCDVNSKFAQSFGSIPAIFSTLREERAEKPPDLTVEFNDAFGYPEVIFINYARWVTDHSVRYSVTEFRGEDRH